MKQREGFVSNSSSSSFIVRYKGAEIKLEVYEEDDDILIETLEKMVKAKIIDYYFSE